MAHEILATDKIIYSKSGGLPWHGLGTEFDVPPESVTEALKLAGLDWNVALEKLYLTDGRAVDRFAVVRDRDDAVLGTVGTDYVCQNNAKVFQPVNQFLVSKAAKIETAGSLKGGARVWMLLKLNKEDSVIVAKDDDRVSKHLLVALGHDGTMAIHYGLTNVRVVCMNTLSVAISGQSPMLRIRHTENAEEAIEAVSDYLAVADQRFERAAEMFRALAKLKVTSKQLKEYVDACFPKPKKVAEEEIRAALEAGTGKDDFAALLAKPAKLSGGKVAFAKDNLAATLAANGHDKFVDDSRRVYDDVARLFEKGDGADLSGSRGTAWGAYNAVTNYLTHESGRSDENRANNLWFGNKGVQAAKAAATMFLGS